MARRTPARGKPGPDPVIRIPEQWNIPAKADHIMKLLSFLDQARQIDWEKLFQNPSRKTAAEVREAFQRAEGSSYIKEVWELGDSEGASLIADWVRERKWPKFESQARMRHLAKSIAAPSMAGRGTISLRRSRDLCSEKATRLPGKERVKGTILHVEPYIECSCRYKGPAKDHQCPRCGAEIPAGLVFSLPKLR